MCFAIKESNKWTKKPVNHFLQDGASAGIRSLQTSISNKTLPNVMEQTSVEIKLTFPEFHFETEAKVDFPSVCI